jgi:predicted nucleic acid-binding protein
VGIASEAVMDSSVIMALVAPEEHSEWALQKLEEKGYFHVLDLSYYEVANAIRYKTSDKFTKNDARTAWLDAVDLMSVFVVHSFSEVIDDAIGIASNLNISVYDAAFLALAEKLGIGFLTLDEKLAGKLEKTKYYRFLKFPSK